MFKNCCGCSTTPDKNTREDSRKVNEAYSKSHDKRKSSSSENFTTFSKTTSKCETAPDSSENGNVAVSTHSAKERSAVNDVCEELPSSQPAAPAASALATVPTPDTANASATAIFPAPESVISPVPAALDVSELRAVACGMLATPHPAKRSGSVPGLGALPRWLSQEDDDDEVFGEGGGTTEPPATPVGRDELALRRHRFFSDLLHAHQAASEHRVRFDPLGPVIAGGFEHEQRTPTVEFESLLSRLEKVTSRLELTVAATEETLKLTGLNANFPEEVDSTLFSLETKNNKNLLVTEGKSSIVLKDPPKANQGKRNNNLLEVVAMTIPAYQNIVGGPLASFLKTSNLLGGDVAAISQLVNEAFRAQLNYLTLAAQSSAPTMDQNMKLLEPTSNQIKAIQDYREKHRGSAHFNHLSAISESIAALGWVTVSPAPAPYVKEMNDAGQFYTNRVLKEWKEKDKTHKSWVDSWVETLSELQKFVKEYHTTGLVWGGKGSPNVGGAPPPPPPNMPPPPPEMPVGELPSGDAQDRSALFAEINRGEAITSSLKKVTPDMQTHKNPTLRSGPAPFKAPVHTNTYKSVTAPGQAVDKPPTFSKEGKKWLIEYQKGNQSLLVDKTEMNNVIYMYKCMDSTLTVKGKVNSVVLDSCRKSSVIFDSVVSSVEFVNCQSVQMQVINKVPTISIDKTDGCQMYLSSESLDVEIVSAKSSEMNVMVPKANGDYAEYPVPEQFKTTLSSKGLSTVSVESKG